MNERQPHGVAAVQRFSLFRYLHFCAQSFTSPWLCPSLKEEVKEVVVEALVKVRVVVEALVPTEVRAAIMGEAGARALGPTALELITEDRGPTVAKDRTALALELVTEDRGPTVAKHRIAPALVVPTVERMEDNGLSTALVVPMEDKGPIALTWRVLAGLILCYQP